MDNQIEKIRTYARSDEIMARFVDVLGRQNAQAFMSSVLVAVSSSPALQKCSPQSIITSAMRAATLRLSCDPSTGQAWLIPFKEKCTFVVGYKGLRDMAIRTGRYRYLNVATIFEGQAVNEDQMRGIHTIEGSKTSNKPIGFMLYFELVSGYSKTYYMTVDEIEDHAARYSRSYAYDDTPWKTNKREMQKKTVLRLGLSKWGYLDPMDVMTMAQSDDAIIDLPPEDAVMGHETPILTTAQIINELGFDDEIQPPTLKELWRSEKVSYETAATIKSSDGIPYVDMGNKMLQGRQLGLHKRLKANGLDPEVETDTRLRLDVIDAIFEARGGER